MSSKSEISSPQFEYIDVREHKVQPKPFNKVQERPDYDYSLSVRDNVLNLIYSFPEANPEEQ